MTTTYTPESIHTLTYTGESINTGTFTPRAFGLTAPILTVAGSYYGFGGLTYSGGQTLTPGHLPTFTSESKTP